MAVSADEVRAIQVCYPQIYLACHVTHGRRRNSTAAISPHESTVLAHLEMSRPTRLTALAAHLGTSKSSLSATMKRLSTLGYVARTPDPRDRRLVHLSLTASGRQAMSTGSVLDANRVAQLLGHLTQKQRAHALEGLCLLARAANSLPHVKVKRP